MIPLVKYVTIPRKSGGKWIVTVSNWRYDTDLIARSRKQLIIKIERYQLDIA